MIARFLLALVLCGVLDAGAAHAHSVLLGHFSPGAGDTYFTVDEREVAVLRYRETTTIDVSQASFRIEARRVADGQLLGARDVVGFVQGDTSQPPILTILFAGDARSQPRQFVLDDGPPRRVLAVPNLPVIPPPQQYRVISVASFPNADRIEQRVSWVNRCTAPSTVPGRESVSSAGGAAFFGDETLYGWYGRDVGSRNYTCRFDIVIPGHATVTMTGPFEPGIFRLFVIGNGIEEPFEVLVFLADRLVSTLGQSVRQPAALLRSENFWFDATRPGQGLSLFEVPGARAVLGTWYTYEADGAPVWYVLDGGHADMPGRRDVVILRARSNANGVEVPAVGTGRLVYADCNEVEFRAVIGNSVRVMSARRAVPVQRCQELD